MHVNNDVDIYEIIYKAKWIDSSWINCSGIYYAPKNAKKDAPIMMYGHGTQIHKQRNISDEDAQQGICLGFAADGYAACYPDYYGIGKEKRIICISTHGQKRCLLSICCMPWMN